MGHYILKANSPSVHATDVSYLRLALLLPEFTSRILSNKSLWFVNLNIVRLDTAPFIQALLS